MTDIQAALGLSQLRRIDEFVSKRNTIARDYDLALAELPLVTPGQSDASYSSYHLYVIRIKKDLTSRNQRQVYQEMLTSGISVNLHYIPVYRQPFYEKMGFKAGHCPQAEDYFSEALSLPIFPDLSEGEFSHVIRSLKSILL
jgi:dTDP-4-amino-4,6-dideoxygalactose transaminase